MGFLAGGEDLQSNSNSQPSDARAMQTIVADLLEKQTILEVFLQQVIFSWL
jgi:hypothetical protein